MTAKLSQHKKFGLSTDIPIFENCIIFIAYYVLRIPLFLLYHYRATGHLCHTLFTQGQHEQMVVADYFFTGSG